MKFLRRVLLLTLMLTLTLSTGAFAMENNMIKVGLKYGSDALFSANLMNYEGLGRGYAMGYYDDARRFVPLGPVTEEREVSITIDGNVFISNGAYYQDMPASYSEYIGGYHLQLKQTFDSYAAAAEVAAAYTGGFVAYRTDHSCVCIGQYRTREGVERAFAAWSDTNAAEIVSPGRTGVMVTITGTDKILFLFDCGGSRSLALVPRSIAGEEPVTWFKGYRYNGGFEYQRAAGGNISVINVVDLEHYVKGVVCWEIGASSPLEAIKAQAVCARTYGAYATRHARQGFDVCTTTDCQVYQGVAASTPRSDQACEETAGEFLFYNGNPVLEAVYYSSNGGASEDAKNVWGGEVGYLKGKVDPYEAYIADRIPGYRWSRTYTSAQLAERLRSRGYEIGTLQSVTAKYTDMGNIFSLTFYGTSGNRTLLRETCRTVLGLGSMRFTVSGGTAETYYINGQSSAVQGLSGVYTISGSGTIAPYGGGEAYVITSGGIAALKRQTQTSASSYTFSGSGSGHNVGLSQYGAMAMAELGHDYRDILQFYYTGVTIEHIDTEPEPGPTEDIPDDGETGEQGAAGETENTDPAAPDAETAQPSGDGEAAPDDEAAEPEPADTDGAPPPEDAGNNDENGTENGENEDQ